jgi:hypothetical protein
MLFFTINSIHIKRLQTNCTILFTGVTLLFFITAYPQSKTIRGVVKDKKTTKPISNVSVLLKDRSLKTRYYSITNELGQFSINFTSALQNDSIYLEVLSIGYKKTLKLLDWEASFYTFFLEESFIDLEKVEVKTIAPIKLNGDTLSYNVDYFAHIEDRTIGDVLKRIPGIAVDESGKISFNGKTILNLYIQGDDLMDGRYGLATKAINKDLIKSIDVLRNFQPIKVLKDKVPTTDIAVNLILKDENRVKIAGQTMLGSGLPSLYDMELNAMIFNKKLKTLNSLKLNNSGLDYQNEFKQFQADNFLSSIDFKRPNLLLSSALPTDPDIPKLYYYLNNSGVINLNSLFNTKDTIQIRTNIQFFADRYTLNFENNISNFTPSDTIQFNQVQQYLRKPFVFNGSINLEVNKATSFISNKLSFNSSSDNDFSSIIFNNGGFNQQLLSSTKNISNLFNWIPRLKGKNVLNIGMNSIYSNMPQFLDVFTGLEPAILNGGANYKAVQQFAETPTLFNHLSASYLIIGRIRQEYLAGIVNERQELNSSIQLAQFNGSINQYNGDVGNKLIWERNKISFTPKYFYKKERWQSLISLPFISQSINYKQPDYQLNIANRRFFFNPMTTFRFDINVEDYIEADYQFSNNLGNISGIYRGLIINNYQTFNRNDAALQEKRASSTGIKYNFQRARILLFMNAGINYSKILANTILSSTISNNIQSTVLLPFENDQSKISINASIKKYLFKLKGNISFSTVSQRSIFNQFVNGQELSFYNDATLLAGQIDAKIADAFTLKYSANLSLSSSKQIKNVNNSPVIENKFRRFNQDIYFGYNPSDKLFFNLRGNHIRLSQQTQPDINYFFMDASLRYKIKKIEFSLEATNLSNIQDYRIFNVSSNQFSEDRFQIRNRMLIARAIFNF